MIYNFDASWKDLTEYCVSPSSALCNKLTETALGHGSCFLQMHVMTSEVPLLLRKHNQ
jgi:hypothetical protein